eukprot:c15850_g1_i1 orf=355-2799(+)
MLQKHTHTLHPYFAYSYLALCTKICIQRMALNLYSIFSCVYVILHLFNKIHLPEVRASNITYACSPPYASYTFCNTSMPVEERVGDLVGRLSLEEKVVQLVNKASGVARLGIPPYEWWSEALHGVSNTGPGTVFGGSVPSAVSFPQVILSAASFNVSLWKAIGQVVSTEARAMYNEGHSGLTFWSPNINIYRDPRWGRGQETPGEDPFLASQYAINYVRGLQDVEGGDSDQLKVAACCKHYTAYDLDNWKGVDRFHFDAEVTQQDLDDTYQPPFKNCIINGNAACVMCSYNRINGVPSCVDKDLLVGTVRKQWGLNGYVASDCDSVEVLYDSIHYTKSPVDAVADSILAGLNMNCGVFLANYTAKAVAEGKLDESKVDESLSYLYTVLMRLGYFNGDPSSQENYGMLDASNVCTKEHRDLALEAARQGIVLLKNNATHGLPLSQNAVKTLAVIGPNANATSTMIGNYAGIPCLYTTPLQGLTSYGANVVYEVGCANVACTGGDLIDSAVKAVEGADAVVLIMGLDQSQEREGFDRTSLSFPGHQEDLIMQIANSAAIKNKPLALVIMSGGPLDVGFAVNLSQISSILWVGYPGEAGGQAIAEVIFGDYNPAGRLPMSWYPESYTKVAMTDMHMRPNVDTGYPGRTYRFYNRGDTLFKFGDGLSYTTFSHSIIAAPSRISLPASPNTNPNTNSVGMEVHVAQLQCEALSFSIRLRVQNMGGQQGDHVVMAFWNAPRIAVARGAPSTQLVAFERVHMLQPQQAVDVVLSLNACDHFTYVNEQGKRILILGIHKLVIGKSEHELYIHHKLQLTTMLD